MIEAVNAVVANASVLRASAGQIDASRTVAANVDRAPVAPQAPYISPHVHVDLNFDKAVIQIRDADTGDVLSQFPSEETLASRQRAEATREQAKAVQQARENANTPIAVESPSAPSKSPAPQQQAAPAPVSAPQAQIAAAALNSAAQAPSAPVGETVSTTA